MKPQRIAPLFLALLLLFTTCQKDTPEPLPQDPDPRAIDLKTLSATDGCQVIQTLWAGAGQNQTSKGTDVGQIVVSIQYPVLHITYQMHPGYYLTEAHLWVGTDPLMIPRNAAPGQFPFKKKTGMVTSHTFVVDLSNMDVSATGMVYAAAHGVVKMGSRQESLWAFGQHTFMELGIARKWGWIFNIDLSPCAPVSDGDPCPGMPCLTDPRDGNTYATVWIGGQCWMKENLRYLPMVSTNDDTRYIVYGYTGTSTQEAMATDNYKNYGVLYNWTTAMDACPAGWHLPSDAEWTQMTNYVLGKMTQYDAGHLGKLLKSCRQVNSPLGGACSTTAHPRWNEHPLHHGIDAMGFAALPGGIGYYFPFPDNVKGLGEEAFFWTSTVYVIGSVYYRNFSYDSGEIWRNATEHAYAMSVRCVKD